MRLSGTHKSHRVHTTKPNQPHVTVKGKFQKGKKGRKHGKSSLKLSEVYSDKVIPRGDPCRIIEFC